MNTNEFRRLITDIKDNNNCRDFATLHLGCQFVNGRCVSPLRTEADNPTSFLADKYSWHDFGSGEHGDIIDLAALSMFHGDKSMAIEYLSGKSLKTKIDPQEAREWERKRRTLRERVEYWHSQLDTRAREYFHKRGITDKTLDRFMVGYSLKRQRYVFPYMKNGAPVYWCARDASGDPSRPKYIKAFITAGMEHPIWGMDTLRGCRRDSGDERDSVLVVAEGMVDALSFAQEGWQVVSAITGRFSAEQERELFEVCRRYERVMVCMDGDKMGQKFERDLCRKMLLEGINFVCGFTPKMAA